ncbi:hypothetical protein NFI96_020359 [Prochilodus magdalenae]|nr:hypothetical protein NFI96_020359 [Prochilodus magdalenae]
MVHWDVALFLHGSPSVHEAERNMAKCSGKMAADTGRYRSAVSKSKDPSGLLISVIRTLSNSDDVQDRETEKSRLEEAYEKCDRDLDELIVQHYTELTTAIRTYQSITERITNSRNKIKQVKENLLSCKMLLHCKRDELRKLWIEGVEHKHVLNLLDEIENIKQVPQKLETFMASKHYLHATDMLVSAVESLEGPLLQVEGLSDLRLELHSKKLNIHLVLIDELHRHLYIKSTSRVGHRGKDKDKGRLGGSAPKDSSILDVSSLSTPRKLTEPLQFGTPGTSTAAQCSTWAFRCPMFRLGVQLLSVPPGRSAAKCSTWAFRCPMFRLGVLLSSMLPGRSAAQCSTWTFRCPMFRLGVPLPNVLLSSILPGRSATQYSPWVFCCTVFCLGVPLPNVLPGRSAAQYSAWAFRYPVFRLGVPQPSVPPGRSAAQCSAWTFCCPVFRLGVLLPSVPPGRSSAQCSAWTFRCPVFRLGVPLPSVPPGRSAAQCSAWTFRCPVFRLGVLLPSVPPGRSSAQCSAWAFRCPVFRRGVPLPSVPPGCSAAQCSVRVFSYSLQTPAYMDSVRAVRDLEDLEGDPEENSAEFMGILIQALAKLKKIPETINAIMERLEPELKQILKRSTTQIADQRGESLAQDNQPRLLLELLELLFDKFNAVAAAHSVVLSHLQQIVVSPNGAQEGIKLYEQADVSAKIQTVLQVLLMDYLDVKNTRSAAEPSAQLSYASTGGDFGAFFAKKKPLRPKQSLFKFESSSHAISMSAYLREQRRELYSKSGELQGGADDNLIEGGETQFLCKPGARNITVIFQPLLR